MKLKDAIAGYVVTIRTADSVREKYERGEPMHPHWDKEKCIYYHDTQIKEALKTLITTARNASEDEIAAVTTPAPNPYYLNSFCSQIKWEEGRADKS